MKILVLNSGSSTQKSCLYSLNALPESPLEPLWSGQITWTQAEVQLKVTTARYTLERTFTTVSRAEILVCLLETLWQGHTQVLADKTDIDIIGHRFVHGGCDYQDPVLITEQVKADLANLVMLAPVHNAASLAGIEAISAILGTHMPQIAVFDTAFHHALSPAAYIYPGSAAWLEQGIRRYGFHGLSYQYCLSRAAELLAEMPSRMIICHLGNGASLAAIRDGKSVDTTMGFTPLAGLMMGSRSGSIDPSIVIYLLRQTNCTADDLERILNQESGLKGLSGLSNDLREVQQASNQGNPQAKLALEVYGHRLRSELGAMLMSLGGLDTLVFTAGIGENSPAIRAAACEGLGFLGLKLDHQKNQQSPRDTEISQPDSAVRVLIIHTEEDWIIAQACWSMGKALCL